MIKHPTVLIFGAGVSSEYGFPLGRGLLLDVARQLLERSALRQSMYECGFEDSLIHEFATHLQGSMYPSIDAFLEHNENYSGVGKAAIAASLIPTEKWTAIIARDAQQLKLYEYLWQQLSATPGTYSGNRVSVVTFNYDRSFEQFLQNSLFFSHGEFRKDREALDRALSNFNVIHVYGSLGTISGQNTEAFLPYDLERNGQSLTPDVILKAANRIKLYHESNKSAGAGPSPIKELLVEAETVCFLGFAFHKINIKWLKFFGLGNTATTQHFVSAYQLPAGEIAALRELLGFKIELGAPYMKSLDVLRHFPVLV